MSEFPWLQMPEWGDPENPWYGHRNGPGSVFMGADQVKLLSRRPQPSSTSDAALKRLTREYADIIRREVEALWPTELWLAADNHGMHPNDPNRLFPGVGSGWFWDQWHRDYDPTDADGSVWEFSPVPVTPDFRFLEAIYRAEIPGPLHFIRPVNGWQFPMIVVYPEGVEPSTADYAEMQANRIPWTQEGLTAEEPEVEEPEDDPDDDPDDYPDDMLEKLPNEDLVYAGIQISSVLVQRLEPRTQNWKLARRARRNLRKLRNRL